MWFYVQRILIGYQMSDAVRHDRPRGTLSDLYPRWLGARELLLHHRDPYGADLTREIQAGYYGRILDPNRAADPKDQQRFAYPVYVVFLLAPLVKLPYSVVQPAFLWLLVLLTVQSVFWWLRALNWRTSGANLLIIVLLTLGSFPAVQGLKLQQLTLLVAPLLALGAVLLTSEQLAAAGVVLAVVTIKPQLTGLLAAWLALWALSDLRRRWRFLAGFALTLAALFAGSELLLPGWFPRFLVGLAAYRQYTGGANSCLDVLVTPAVGHWLSVVVILATAVFCWRTRKFPSDSREFALATAMVLAITVVVVPMVAPYNQLLLLPAIFLILRDWKSLYRSHGARLLTMVAVLTLVWPWLTAVALTVAWFFLRPEVVQRAWAVPLYTSVGMPLAVVTLLTPLLLARGNQGGVTTFRKAT